MTAETNKRLQEFFAEFAGVGKPHLLLDYDGTLAAFRVDRFQSRPWAGVRELLQRIQRGDLDTHDHSPLESLSPRELQVLRLVAEGKTSKDIAVLLDLGLQTIRSYRKTMMKKLGVNNVAGLTQLALAAGITHWNKPDANTLG